MREDHQPDRKHPEEEADAAAIAEAPSRTGPMASRTAAEAKPASGLLDFAFSASMLLLSWVRGWIRDPRSKPRQIDATLPRCPCEEQHGDQDKTLARQSDADLARRRSRGTLFVLCAFFVGIAGGIGFVFLYWTGGGNRLLGLTLALCLGGFGAVLVLYAQWLIRHELVIAPREAMPSSRAERKDVFKDYASGAYDIQRRGLLKWMGAGVMGLFAVITFSFLRSLARSHPAESLFTTVWKSGQRLMTADGEPITIHSLEPGSSVTVFPESSIGSQRAQTVLIRVDQNRLKLPQSRANWAPMGYIAYSRVCTHAGCAVGLYEAQTNLLLCPCHQSTFDVLRAAAPTGGPAARPLPQLPLYVNGNGYLCAGGGFSSPPGPGFTGMPS